MNTFSKVKVIDSRITQNTPVYKINEGATETSNVSFDANNASASSLTFNVNTPSKHTFIDRRPTITATVLNKITATVAAGATDTRQILRFGDNCSLCAYPLQSLMTTLAATINNTTITTNLKDNIYEKLRMANLSNNQGNITTPSMLDKYASYDDANLNDNSPMRGYDKARNGEIPNGSYPHIEFTDANGIPLSNQSSHQIAANAGTAVDIYFKFTVTENILLSPFLFNGEDVNDTGLYGVNNLQLQANIGDASRILRIYNDNDKVTFSNNSLYGAKPFSGSRVNFQFRNPSLSVPLPEKSVVPFMDTPSFSTSFNTSLTAGEVKSLNMSGITLGQIPDLLVIYVKPEYSGSFATDHYLPPQSISMMFDNRSGILSSQTREQLFDMSRRNGLNMDYNEFLGDSFGIGGVKSKTVGGFLVLQPGIDFALPSGSASGVGGNYNLQFNLTVKNHTTSTITNPTLYCMAINSGFFESVNGTSSLTTVPLVPSDVIQAPIDDSPQTSDRMVGGSFFNKLNSTLKKVLKSPVTKKLANVGKKFARATGDPRASAAADLVDMAGYGKNTGGGAGSGGLNGLMY